MPTPRPAIIAHHLIWTLYGHGLPNDLRGSGSEAVRDPKLGALGEAHFGRKPKRDQPTREELREFQRQAGRLLQHRPFWMDEAKRQAVADAIAGTVAKKSYTVWACAILSNHAYMVIRRHRDDALAMWKAIAEAVQPALRRFGDVGDEHPVLAARPYKVFVHSPEEVRGRIQYVNGNPAKEGLPEQRFDFVKSYDNWPFHQTCSVAG